MAELLLYAAIFALAAGSGGAIQMQVAVTSLQSSYGYVTLRCVCDSAVCTRIAWQRRLNDTLQDLRPNQQSGELVEITFLLTPLLEGRYSCVVNGSRSNEVDLVANLVPNPAISKASQYQVYGGDSVTLPCVFTPGAFTDNYRLEWQKDLTPIYGPQGASLPARYLVSQQNFSLTITSANVSDAGLFQCSVTVINPRSGTATSYAPPISLSVTAPLNMVHAPTAVVLTRTKEAAFSCAVSGSPKPRVVWLHRGTEIKGRGSGKYTLTEGVVTSPQTYVVTSRLAVGAVEVSDNGEVTCLAVSETQQVLIGSVDLVVLASVSSVQLQVLQDGSVQINITMTAIMPGPLSFVLSYTPSPPSQSFGSYVTQLADPSFIDVQDITYKIPQQKLPFMFSSFSVKVALVVQGVQGEMSKNSNVVTLTSATSSAPNVAASGSECHCDNTPLIIAIVLILVVVLMVVGAVVVAALVVVWYKHRNKETSIELEYHDSSVEDHKCESSSKEYRQPSTQARASSSVTLDSGELAKMEDQAVRMSASKTLPCRVHRTKVKKFRDTHSSSVGNVSLPSLRTDAGHSVHPPLQCDQKPRHTGNDGSSTPLPSPPPYTYNTVYRKKVLGVTNPMTEYSTTDV